MTTERLIESSDAVRNVIKSNQTGKAEFFVYRIAVTNNNADCEYAIMFDQTDSDSVLFRYLTRSKSL